MKDKDPWLFKVIALFPWLPFLFGALIATQPQFQGIWVIDWALSVAIQYTVGIAFLAKWGPFAPPKMTSRKIGPKAPDDRWGEIPFSKFWRVREKKS